MVGARGSPKKKQTVEQIVRQVLEDKQEPKYPAANGQGERFAIEAARRAVREAYGRQKAAAGKGHSERRPTE